MVAVLCVVAEMKLSAISEADFEKASCSGKHPFASYNQAMKAVAHMEHAQAYRCRYCSKYHVSHHRKEVERKPKPEIPELDMHDFEERN